jgi:hypothetical protein
MPKAAAAADSRLLIVVSRTAREAMDVAAGALGVSIAEIARRGRARAQVAYARQIAMYLAHVVGQMTLSEIATAFERDRTTVAHACHAIEDRREGTIFDKQIEALEADMRARVNAIFGRKRVRAAVSTFDVACARRDLGERARARRFSVLRAVPERS